MLITCPWVLPNAYERFQNPLKCEALIMLACSTIHEEEERNIENLPLDTFLIQRILSVMK